MLTPGLGSATPSASSTRGPTGSRPGRATRRSLWGGCSMSRSSSTRATTAFFSVLLVLVGLWLPAIVNLSGVKNIGSVQVVTTVVKYLAVGFMATVGLFFISSANYTPWNVSGESAVWSHRRRAWPSRCSAISGSRPQRLLRPRSATPIATSRGRPSSARWPPRSSTCCR